MMTGHPVSVCCVLSSCCECSYLNENSANGECAKLVVAAGGASGGEWRQLVVGRVGPVSQSVGGPRSLRTRAPPV